MNSALAQTLTSRHGTPLYAYDLAAVSAQCSDLFGALPEGSSICYSFKANPLPAIARRVRECGGRAEITSEGELIAALNAGFSGEQILFGGPGKTAKELDAAINAGVRMFSSESLRDLGLLSEACARHDIEVDVLLRVNPEEAPDARLAMTGVESQFGFAEPILLNPSVRSQVMLPRLRIIGVHIYFGTQVAGVEALVTNTRRALECAGRVETALDFQCRIINAGGGFPWTYANDHTPPSLEGLRAPLTEAWNASAFKARGAELWFESGRWLCASSGWLIARVLDLKPFPTRTFVVLDTGIHHLGGMAGLGRVQRGAVSLFNLSRDTTQEPPMIADLVGPLCTPLDSLARGLKIPPVQVGDLVGIPNVGAYGITASLLGFLSHPPPVEVAHEAGQEVEVWQLRHGHARLSA
ncbi:type III PLP-dependent enzyme [Brevifollis gellanilyticus]|uniref:Diaminopimelate decarboxylase n=1 Tax=Brevifollis gellanilyticus TaxID=748831 RepID=A0A512ME11_9BACT|nr:type III PLP-dependent enzyme [Brevifollis gellanilyticus]GEP44966.1 diaminopimelate decarboxylase [Brevifollis gellanilyticus]